MATTTAFTTSERKLFQRPNGTPYDVWIQTDFDIITRDRLKDLVEEHGGHVTDFAVFPEHGFIFLDPVDPSAMYEVKTSFHKPVERRELPYIRTSKPTVTPLRHVLSYRFIEAVIEKGSWDYLDLLRWGFPVATSKKDEKRGPKKAVKMFQNELKWGVDHEMEKGWILRTGTVFDSYDPTYGFEEEFKIVDQEIAKHLSLPDPKKYETLLKGMVVAECRMSWQMKFYLHADIPRDEEEVLIRTIMENGGATCYESSEANVILIGCKDSEIEEDVDIMDWMNTSVRLSKEGRPYTLVKFTSWVARCVEAGDWRDVDDKTLNVTRAYKAFQRRKLSAQQKGKGRAIDIPAGSAPRKRKRDSDEYSTLIALNGSPAKKRKLPQDESLGTAKLTSNGSTSKSSRKFPSNLGAAPTDLGSGSTIRPTRVFTGITVPNTQPSPLKYDGNVSSLVLVPKVGSRLKPITQSVEDERQGILPVPSEDIPEDEQHSIIFDPHQHSRFSAASVLTVDTATSKAANTTTNTATTGTTKSARSVGPSDPPNAHQIGRPSTSTGADIEVSGTSRELLDQSVEPPTNKLDQAAQPTLALDSDFEPDDRAGDVILSSFPSAKGHEAPKDALLNLGPDEEKLILCWRRMSKLDYKEGLETIERVVSGWPDVERELLRKGGVSKDRKGKGRVSFYESARDLETDQDVVLETDLDEAKGELPQGVIKSSSNLRAYARQRGVSKTPESVVSSDEEASLEKELATAQGKPPKKANVVESLSGSPISHKATSRRKAPSRNRSPLGVSSRPRRRGTSKDPSVSRMDAATTNTEAENNGDEDETVPDSEENEELAPLPSISAKRRSQRKRAESVISEEGSVADEVRPRRGRSASAAPPEHVIGVATTAKRSSRAGGPSSRRKVDVKPTGVKTAQSKN